MDDCARVFAANLYKNLLRGKSIIVAFENAKKAIANYDPDEIDFNVSCCAHDHDVDCQWNKIYLEDREKALKFHHEDNRCRCEKRNDDGVVIHLENCEKFKTFEKEWKN
jgi:hypothetical protein